MFDYRQQLYKVASFSFFSFLPLCIVKHGSTEWREGHVGIQRFSLCAIKVYPVISFFAVFGQCTTLLIKPLVDVLLRPMGSTKFVSNFPVLCVYGKQALSCWWPLQCQVCNLEMYSVPWNSGRLPVLSNTESWLGEITSPTPARKYHPCQRVSSIGQNFRALFFMPWTIQQPVSKLGLL